MKTYILNLEDTNDWQQYLEKLPTNQIDIYFSPQYYKLYDNNGDGDAYCFVFEKNGNTALYPFLKCEINNLGYNLDEKYYDIQGAYGYNGVVSSNYEEHFIDEFYKSFHQFCEANNIIYEFCRFHPLINNHLFSKNHLTIKHDRETVLINLNKPIEELKASFSSSNKRALKKALKTGVEVKVYKDSFPYQEEFINLYNETMKRLNSSEYLYFKPQYFDDLFKQSSTIQFVGLLNGKPIASLLCIASKDYFHYHLGCSKLEYLNFRPNNLLFYEMISYAKESGCKFIHFGGGKTKSLDDSLLKFKSSFSKERSDFYIGEKIHNESIYNKIVNQWEHKHPEKKEKCNDYFLKYRL